MERKDSLPPLRSTHWGHHGTSLPPGGRKPGKGRQRRRNVRRRPDVLALAVRENNS